MTIRVIFALALSALGMSGFMHPAWGQTFVETERFVLISDGPNHGLESYALIRNAFGKKSIESPDLYRPNHQGAPHIIEAEDDLVGPHFVFLSHRDADKDRDKDFTDRQRNEIKVYDGSNAGMKAFKGQTVQYRWVFKVDEDFEFSKNFTHFFQIKAKNFKKKNAKDSDKFPVITFTAVDKGAAGNRFQIRHSPSLDSKGQRIKFETLVQEDMSNFAGQWIEFFVQITFEDNGQLIVKAKNMETGEMLVDLKESNIDMWRGEQRADFSRPKWGIYRSLKDSGSLRNTEEKARFAVFSIRKGRME